MKTTRIITSTAIALALAVSLTSCSSDTDQTVAVEPAPSVVATTPAAEETEQPAVLAPEADVPAVGETVAAGQVEAIRAAGAAVYVSPLGDGTGIVVQPGQELPAAVQAEVVSVASSAPPTAMADLSNAGLVQVNDALIAAGTGAFVLQYGGEFNTDGSLKRCRASSPGTARTPGT